jgi:3-oxoacyl-[acyl-carrier-protein] synthase-1
MKLQPASVLSAGAVCALGGGVAQIEAAARAGLSAISASSIYDRWFEPIKMALVPEDALEPLVPEVDALPLTSRQRRMLRLATPALHQAVTGIAALERVPLFLGLPEAHLTRPPPVDATFMRHLQQQTGLTFEPKLSRPFMKGRAAGLLALEAGLSCLSERRAELVVVGGVDTFLDLALLAELDAEARLLGERVMDGFVPGEGAAFVVLGSTAQRQRGAKSPVVRGAGCAVDPGNRYGDQPAKGEGLSEAIEKLLETLAAPPSPIHTTYAGLNGESFGAKEWGVARLRHNDLFDPASGIEHPADCYGDTGAAAGVLLLALAQRALADGRNPGSMLIWASSDRGDCGCTYLDLLA